MEAERIRAYLLTLPHAVETMQWGANLVFWIGDKAIGGKMFALINLDGDTTAAAERNKISPVISYAAGPERYSELLETEGILPAPYMARIYWVAAERWSVFRSPEWEHELSAAHALTFAKLPANPRRPRHARTPAKASPRRPQKTPRRQSCKRQSRRKESVIFLNASTSPHASERYSQTPANTRKSEISPVSRTPALAQSPMEPA